MCVCVCVCVDSDSSRFYAIIIPLDHLHKLYYTFINGVRAAHAGRKRERDLHKGGHERIHYRDTVEQNNSKYRILNKMSNV